MAHQKLSAELIRAATAMRNMKRQRHRGIEWGDRVSHHVCFPLDFSKAINAWLTRLIGPSGALFCVFFT